LRFRKKPVVVEAVQWFPGVAVDGVFIECQSWTLGCIRASPHVHTLEGPIRVAPGDWIITGVKGEKYPCKPDIFEATYDRVTDVVTEADLDELERGLAMAISCGDYGNDDAPGKCLDLIAEVRRLRALVSLVPGEESVRGLPVYLSRRLMADVFKPGSEQRSILVHRGDFDEMRAAERLAEAVDHDFEWLETGPSEKSYEAKNRVHDALDAYRKAKGAARQ
jgi:hypothetical protein